MANTPRPLGSPVWATNANYAAGPYPGNANKAVPPGGVVGEGFDPQTGMPVEWINYLLNLNGDFSAYLDGIIAGRGFWLYDDFLAANANINPATWDKAGGDSILQVQDGANNGWGALNLQTSLAGGSPAVVYTSNLPIGTSDFAFWTSIRFNSLPALANYPTFLIGLFDRTTGNIPQRACIRADNTTARWQFEYGATAVNTSQNVSTAYVRLMFLRINGQLYFFSNELLDGGPIAFGTDFTDLANAAVYLDVPGAGAVSLFIDSFKLWVDR